MPRCTRKARDEPSAHGAPRLSVAEGEFLVHLELDTGIHRLWMASSQRSGEPIVRAAIRVVAPNDHLRVLASDLLLPRRAEGELRRAARVIEQTDVCAAHHAIQLR